jgi:hypothetical protein
MRRRRAVLDLDAAQGLYDEFPRRLIGHAFGTGRCRGDALRHDVTKRAYATNSEGDVAYQLVARDVQTVLLGDSAALIAGVKSARSLRAGAT